MGKWRKFSNKEKIDFINIFCEISEVYLDRQGQGDKHLNQQYPNCWVYYNEYNLGLWNRATNDFPSELFIPMNGIKPEVHTGYSIGWSESEQLWYGWSHRAIYGFGIGHTLKAGHVGFKPSNIEEFKVQNNYWADEYDINPEWSEVPMKEHNEYGSRLLSYLEENSFRTDIFLSLTSVYSNDIPNKELVGKYHEQIFFLPKKWGRGEWTAKTLDDAKEMAINFSKRVS